MKWIKLDFPTRIESVPSQFFIRSVTRLGKRTVILYRYDSTIPGGYFWTGEFRTIQEAKEKLESLK